jgi:hypothetical protein
MFTISNFNEYYPKNPGDKLEIYITKSGLEGIRSVQPTHKEKRCAIKYPNGTIVETRSYKR